MGNSDSQPSKAPHGNVTPPTGSIQASGPIFSNSAQGPPAGALVRRIRCAKRVINVPFLFEQKKAYTFDERGLDTARQRHDGFKGAFMPLKKSMTFVDKRTEIQADVFGYQDILYSTWC